MNLVYGLLNEPFVIDYGHFYNITIENLEEFRRVIDGVKNKEYVKIYNEDKIISNYELVDNIFSLNYEDRKIINKIIKDISELSKSDLFIEKYHSTNLDLYNFLSDLILEYDVPLEVRCEFDFSYILKAFGIKLNFDNSSFLEVIVNYIELYLEVFNVEIFIFINLTQFLNEEELLKLFDYIKNKQILIINYDRIYRDSKIITNQLLFDYDLCRVI